MWRPLTAAIAMWCLACPAGAMNTDYEIGVLSCALSDPSDSATTSASGDGTREVLCTFQPKEGMEETYVGTAYGVSITPHEQATFIWIVRSPSGPSDRPGQVQKIFANDTSQQPEQKPPLIGSEGLALHSLSDRSEGSVSSQEKPTPVGFVILRLELQLRSSIV
jgi:Protein of unknown function (DUF992)